MANLSIFLGACKLSKAVLTTLGPGGRNVAIDPWSPDSKLVSKDL